jgi:hypothetical protein
MSYGGLAPYPKRYGAASGSLIEAVTESLLAARGPLFDPTDHTTIAYVEANAEARAICELYEFGTRCRNQFDPARMADFVPRWEAIFRISPPPNATMASRRAAIGVKFARLAGGMRIGKLYALIAQFADIGATLKTWRTHDSGVVTHMKVTTLIPSGVSVTGDGMWGSSIHSLTFVCAQPSGMAWADFRYRMGQLEAALVDIVPAWCTFYVVKKNSGGTIGFKLDEPNLGIECMT